MAKVVIQGYCGQAKRLLKVEVVVVNSPMACLCERYVHVCVGCNHSQGFVSRLYNRGSIWEVFWLMHTKTHVHATVQ